MPDGALTPEKAGGRPAPPRRPRGATDAEPTEPPTDGVPDALFEISQADFARLYNSVDIVP